MRSHPLKIVSTLAFALITATAFADPPILQTAFAGDEAGWSVVNITGQPVTGKVTVTHAPAHIKEGKGSLQYDYTIKKGDSDLLLLPAGLGTLLHMKSLHFWIQADHPTSFLLIASEKDGGRYQTMINAPAGTWQEVNVAVADLTLNQDEGSPKDPDGKLDVDQIEGIALIDADCYLAQIFGDAGGIVNLPGGLHTVYISPFTINDMELISAPPAAKGVQLLTPLLRPQVDWLVVGDASVQKADEKPATGPSVKVSYKQTPGKLVALIKDVKPGQFTNTTQMSFSFASKVPVTLLVQLEKSDGGKYNTMVPIAGGSVVKEVVLKFADFTRADDSKDTDQKLDLPLVKRIMIADASGLTATQEQDNSLWFNHLQISGN